MPAPRGQQEIEYQLNLVGRADRMFAYRPDIVRRLYLRLSSHDRAGCNIDKPCGPVPDLLTEAKAGADLPSIQLSGEQPARKYDRGKS